MPHVLTLLPDIAVHVVETKIIGREDTDLRCLLANLAFFASTIGPLVKLAAYFSVLSAIVSQLIPQGLAKVERGCCTSATGILPFTFTGQAIVSVGVLREPLAEFNGIIPTHLLNWPVLAFKVGRTWL